MNEGDGEGKAVFRSTTYSHSKGDFGCSFALTGLALYVLIILPFSVLVVALSIYAIAVSDDTPVLALMGIGMGGGLSISFPFILLIVGGLFVLLIPNPSKITATVDGRGVHTEYGFYKIANYWCIS